MLLLVHGQAMGWPEPVPVLCGLPCGCRVEDVVEATKPFALGVPDDESAVAIAAAMQANAGNARRVTSLPPDVHVVFATRNNAQVAEPVVQAVTVQVINVHSFDVGAVHHFDDSMGEHLHAAKTTCQVRAIGWAAHRSGRLAGKSAIP